MYWIGHIATLVSIFAIFASLAVAFLIRSANPAYWRPIHLPRQLVLSTILLLAASAMAEMSRYVLKRRAPMQIYTSWLIRSGLFAMAFVVAQALCWRLMLEEVAANNTNERFFYVLTGTHAVHVLGGMVALCYLLWRGWHPWENADALRRQTITTMLATYWHFMGAIWIGLYLMIWTKAA